MRQGSPGLPTSVQLPVDSEVPTAPSQLIVHCLTDLWKALDFNQLYYKGYKSEPGKRGDPPGSQAALGQSLCSLATWG